MPAIYAHYIFGEKMKKALAGNGQDKKAEDNDLFAFGLHGPDLLFYYHALVKNRVNRTGFGMHDLSARPFFERAASVIRNLQGEERARALSYILGFLCHFTLDRRCHGYIENKIRIDQVSHVRIEADFDRYLVAKYGGTPLKTKLTSHLHPSRDNARVIQMFFPQFSRREMYRTQKSMVWYNDRLISSGSLSRAVIKGVMRLSGDYHGMRGLLMDAYPDPLCRDSCLRLEKLMELAVADGQKIIDNFIEYLEGRGALGQMFDDTFGPGRGWEEIPVLPYEEEIEYEI